MAARKEISNDEIIFENNFSDPEEDIEEDSPQFCHTEHETHTLSTSDLAAKLKPQTGNKKYGEDAGPTNDVLFKKQQSARNQSNHSAPLFGFQNDRAQENRVHEYFCFRNIQRDLGVTGQSVFSSGWELKDTEIKCLPIIPRACIKTNSDNRKIEAEKDKPKKPLKQGGLRLLNKRSKKGAYGGKSRIKYTSAMGMLTTIAKAYGLDVAMLLEESEHVLGSKGSMRLPCMQCYEKGESGGGLTGAGSLMEDPFGNETATVGDENRCSKCGGLVQTLASFGKMITKMRTVLQEKDLIPHDVYPDGNCMFAAVVDQLRIRGDFTFTMHTLRDAAVQYLRQNPTSDDGTHLEMFLANDETWETYLTRMSEDGEWGDHIVLRALSDVTGIPISIFGGMSGQEKTFIYPSATSKDKEGEQDTDKHVEDTPVIYLGHVGESHYMSLRPKRWRQLLYDDTKMKATKETVEERCPVQQIDFILRQAFRMDIIKSRDWEYVESIVPIVDGSDKDGYRLNMVGSVICMMVPSKSCGDDLLPDISIFFPVVKENEMPALSDRSVLTSLKTPDDTKIVFSVADANAVDLVAENHQAPGGQLYLIPKQPGVWSGQTVKLSDQRICLKTFELNIRNNMYESFRKVIPSLAQEKAPDLKTIIAFKCSWPPHAAEWPSRRRQAAFPDDKTIQVVVQEGCHVVPYSTDKMFDDIYDYPSSYRKPTHDHSWAFTFASAEKEISRFLTADHRQCFLLFKFWVDMATNESSIPNSILKSIFFYACENIAKEVWKSKPGECLLILLKKLAECLVKEIAPHYFLANKNLLEVIPREHISKWYERLQVSLLQPVVTLYFVLDQLDVLSSELGRFLEEIMEETNRVQNHALETSDFHEALMPACSTLLASLITQKDYQRAMFILQDLTGQGEHNDNTDLSYVDALKKSCWHIHIRDQWCFAFFVDIRMKTKLTMKLCEGYASVSITEVFGPECTEELPDTLVPETFRIANGDTNFAYDVSEVLSQCVSTKCYIKSLKYYLNKYAEYAGDALVLPCENFGNVYITTDTGSLSEKEEGIITSKMAGQSLLLALQNIYVCLFNTCLNSNKVEEFREMMPVMTKVVEESDSQMSRSNLKRMWKYLGETDKAEQVNVPSRGRQSKQYLLSLYYAK